MSLEIILKNIDCSTKEFEDICDNFTNKELFKCDNNGKLIKKDDGSLILRNPLDWNNFISVKKNFSSRL